ncbi:MAG: DUF4190 domain-containing protein [Planctomycetota bacterium]
MSQLDTPPFDAMAGGPQKTSGLAIASLVCSLICCIPVIPVIGILLGLGAMISIGGDPAKKGKGLAIAGIILGVVITTGQGVVGYRMYAGYTIFSSAPYVALQPGFDGDIAAMKANFGSSGATATDREAQAFVDELRSRYGALQGSAMDFQAFQGMQMPTSDQKVFTMPWVLVFENASVAVEMTFNDDDQTRSDEIIFSAIRVIDSDLGDLTFPAAAALEEAMEEAVEEAIEEMPEAPPEVPAEVPTAGDAG